MEKYRFSHQEQALLESLPQPFAVYQFVDKRVVTLALSDGFCELFGYEDRAQAYHDMDHDMYRDTHPDDAARIADAAVRFAEEGGSYEVIYRTRIRNSADYRIIYATGRHVHTASGVRLAYVWYVDEGAYAGGTAPLGSELNRSLNNALREERLLKASQFDYLTGLPSMTYFFELAEAGKQALEREGRHPVLLFLDMSGMKFFNTKNGFAEGDRLLRDFSRVLVGIFHSENCCHIGGDHFAVFTAEEGLEEVLARLFRECGALNGGESLPVRVGIYPGRLENVPASVACDRAKFACDSLRNTFESGFSYYDKNLRDDAERRQYILANLDRALEERWIQVYYQPIVRAVSGRVCDEEALARWIDPVRGFLSPAEFIPALEEAGVIYKLDLYVVDRVLEKLKRQEREGLTVVPNSVNLSRVDFEACDIVEEIRRRVDAAGIGRDKITIEITESVIGSDLDFMKGEVERFQALGFPVWMDDFGSGYSSLNVLQTVKFTLLKFDMSFMRKLDEGDKAKILLTELMKMATSLGVDTVCEGVETEAQVRFLQEIGCAKLQGYYYGKPIPVEKILERYATGTQVGFENPDESDYFEAIGRVNLYDLAVIANEDENAFQNFFNTLPMGIMEIKDGRVRFVRSNRSYRDFMKRFFGHDLTDPDAEFSDSPFGPGSSFMQIVRQCCENGSRALFDEQMPDGSVVHSFARWIGTNPVTGRVAVAIAVLSISEPDEGTTYASIARALAADYYNLYYVDLDTDRFIEYSSPVGGEELAMERHGERFFEAARRDTMTRIYEKDRERFLGLFTKENIVRELDEQGVFTLTYRLIDTGAPMYVHMKIMRMRPDGRHLIFGISIIDSQMRQQELIDTIRREEATYARVMALSGDYLSLYTVDPVTGRYFEYSATSEYESLGFAKMGENFFLRAVLDGEKAIHPDDYPMYRRRIGRENVLREIAENGVFLMDYRLMIRGTPKPVVLKIVMVRESEGEKLIAGVRTWSRDSAE